MHPVDAGEIRVHGESTEMRDPAPAVLHLEFHASGESPSLPVVDLDHKPPVVVRLSQRPLDLRGDGVALTGASAGEVRIDVPVVRELDEEVDVLGLRAADADAHRPGSTAGARALGRKRPDPSATPSRISARPPASAAVIGSPRKTAP